MTLRPDRDLRSWPFALLVSALALSSPASAAETAPPADGRTGRFAKDGVVVDFTVEGGAPDRPLMQADLVEVRFRLTDATSGQPVRGLAPAAWMDMAESDLSDAKECKEKVSLYLRGLVGIRPLVDLNSYFVLVMNADPSISVVDPIVGMTGKTSLYATVLLERPGADWAKSRDEKRLYVSMPRAGKVAVVNAETFKLVRSVPAGEAPTRVVLQHDGRRLWVGNDTKDGAGGVTVIDTGTLEVVARISTGRGHHEIALSADDRRAFVTNRGDGTVTVIDAATLAKVKDVPAGAVPISIARSSLSQAIYVADAKGGRVTVLDPASGDVLARIPAAPGLGPLRFSPDGRWGFVVNPAEHAVHVIDAADHRLAHTIPAGGEPYQVAFTRAFAYLRLLDSEQVKMVNLSSLGRDDKPTVQGFPAGARAPKLARDLSLADGIAASGADAGVFVVSPGDNGTYFYMEGMNAPMGSFGAYGHPVRAVTVVDRSLKEIETGVYAAQVRLPAAGRYAVAIILDTPRVVHCFALDVKPNPALRERRDALVVEWTNLPGRITADTPLRLRVLDPDTRAPKRGIRDLELVFYRAPGTAKGEAPAREVEAGVYEVRPAFASPGAYYLYVAAPSQKVFAGDLPYRTVSVTASGALANGRERAPAAREEGTR